MNINKITGSNEKKNILLLQGSMGDFYNQLENILEKDNANIFRIGLNYSDEFFSSKKYYEGFKGKPKEWKKFIKTYFQEKNINRIFVFGDCRFYQRIAIKEAKKLDIDVFVFEEGYFRPNFITLEKNGVNNYSQIPRNREYYQSLDLNDIEEFENEHKQCFGSTYGKMARSAAKYFFLSSVFKYKYPYYRHHRCFSFVKEGFLGTLNYVRKNFLKIYEHNKIRIFENELSKKYFLVPLQTYSDFQIKTHSDYKGIEDFIIEVIKSFALNSKEKHHLVFKHHPMDRGNKNYETMISKLAKQYGMKDRVHVVWDLHLPTMIKHSIGTITINSTVGLSSLYHGIPTKCTGRAIYDFEGLTSHNIELDEFWIRQAAVDMDLFKKYRAYIIKHTQLNYNFYL